MNRGIRYTLTRPGPLDHLFTVGLTLSLAGIAWQVGGLASLSTAIVGVSILVARLSAQSREKRSFVVVASFLGVYTKELRAVEIDLPPVEFLNANSARSACTDSHGAEISK